MAIAQRLAVTAFRNDPLHVVFEVVGLDLTNATMRFAVKLFPDAPGPALLTLVNQTTPGGAGLRVVSVIPDDDGVPISLIEGIATKASIQALPPSADPRAPVTLAHDFQWTLAADGSGLTPLEETIFFGDFILMGSVND